MPIEFSRQAGKRVAEATREWVGTKGTRAAKELQHLLLESSDRVTVEAVLKTSIRPADQLEVQALKQGIPATGAALTAKPIARSNGKTVNAKEAVNRVRQARLVAAFSESTSAKQLTELGTHPDAAVREAVASNKSAPPEILAALANDAALAVRRRIAANPRTPPEALANLATHDDPVVRGLVAANESTPPEVLARLAQDLDSEVRLAVVNNAKTPADEIMIFAAGSKVRLAEHPGTPANVLAKLAASPDLAVRVAVARNPNTPPEVLVDLAGTSDVAVLRAVASNISTPRYPEVVDKVKTLLTMDFGAIGECIGSAPFDPRTYVSSAHFLAISHELKARLTFNRLMAWFRNLLS